MTSSSRSSPSKPLGAPASISANSLHADTSGPTEKDPAALHTPRMSRKAVGAVRSKASINSIGPSATAAATSSHAAASSSLKNAAKINPKSISAGNITQPKVVSGLGIKLAISKPDIETPRKADGTRQPNSKLLDAARRSSQPRLSIIDDRAKRQLEGEESEREPKINGILRWRFSKKLDTEIYATAISPNDEYIFAAGGNSSITVFSTKTNTKEIELVAPGSMRMPCTSISLRSDSPSYKNKSILAAAYADGKIRHWHYTSGQLISTISEGDNQINSLSYFSDGSSFVTGGSDTYVRVYDGETHKLAYKASAGHREVTAGHSNRIFCTKFHPKDRNMIISGGWDNTLQIWDLRVSHSIRSVYGPHVCGDAIDFDDSGDRFLTGSYTKDNQLQIWSWNTFERIDDIVWSQGIEGEPPMSLVYSAQFSKGVHPNNLRNRFIVGGCAGGSNEARIFLSDSKRHVGSITYLNCAVYSVSISPIEKMVVAGGGGKTLIVADIEEHTTDGR